MCQPCNEMFICLHPLLTQSSSFELCLMGPRPIWTRHPISNAEASCWNMPHLHNNFVFEKISGRDFPLSIEPLIFWAHHQFPVTIWEGGSKLFEPLGQGEPWRHQEWSSKLLRWAPKERKRQVTRHHESHQRDTLYLKFKDLRKIHHSKQRTESDRTTLEDKVIKHIWRPSDHCQGFKNAMACIHRVTICLKKKVYCWVVLGFFQRCDQTIGKPCMVCEFPANILHSHASISVSFVSASQLCCRICNEDPVSFWQLPKPSPFAIDSAHFCHQTKPAPGSSSASQQGGFASGNSSLTETPWNQRVNVLTQPMVAKSVNGLRKQWRIDHLHLVAWADSLFWQHMGVFSSHFEAFLSTSRLFWYKEVCQLWWLGSFTRVPSSDPPLWKTVETKAELERSQRLPAKNTQQTCTFLSKQAGPHIDHCKSTWSTTFSSKPTGRMDWRVGKWECCWQAAGWTKKEETCHELCVHALHIISASLRTARSTWSPEPCCHVLSKKQNLPWRAGLEAAEGSVDSCLTANFTSV